jgi:hypothetical protein
MIKGIYIWAVILSISTSFITALILINRLTSKMIQQENEFLEEVKKITIKTVNEKIKNKIL